MVRRISQIALLSVSALTIAACGGRGPTITPSADPNASAAAEPRSTHPEELETTNTIWDIFNRQSSENTVQVNRYLWAASLEVLNFLPVQTIDPFTGVIVTGFGTPPGGGRAYRATILIDDPALEARALNLALQTRGGPASAATIRAVEDAILTRARQLRVADSRL